MKISEKLRSEPIGLLALAVSMAIPLLQSDWFWDLFDEELKIIAFYELQPSGQCGLAALQIENPSQENRGDIRVHIVEDWITKRGDESLNVGTRSEMLLTSAAQTPIPFREELHVPHSASGNVISVPKISSGEYLDLFFAREVSSEMNNARSSLGEDSRYWNTPRAEYAVSDEGTVPILSVGKCLNEHTMSDANS